MITLFFISLSLFKKKRGQDLCRDTLVPGSGWVIVVLHITLQLLELILQLTTFYLNLIHTQTSLGSLLSFGGRGRLHKRRQPLDIFPRRYHRLEHRRLLVFTGSHPSIRLLFKSHLRIG